MSTAPRREELIERAGRGDDAAWEQLVDTYRGRLRALARSEVPEPIQRSVGLDDLTQEILVAVCKGLPGAEFTTLQSFEVWLMQVARHRLVDLVRRSSTLKRGAGQPAAMGDARLDSLAGDATSPSRSFQRREAQQNVQRILQRLPADYRQVLELVRIHRRQTSEVARILDISPAAVRKRLERALHACRDLVDSESFDGIRETTDRDPRATPDHSDSVR